jgi:hypothetical protein
VVDQYTKNELKQNRMATVLDPDLQLLMQFSPFGVIPKKQLEGDIRLVCSRGR